jgi:hypothetical protein
VRIIFAGGRNYTDAIVVAYALAHYAPTGPHTLVHGACKVVHEDGTPYVLGPKEKPGADRLAHYIALGFGWTVELHPALWSQHGDAAGPIRSKHMAELGADGLIVVPGGRGTRRMIEFAQKARIPVWEPVRAAAGRKP